MKLRVIEKAQIAADTVRVRLASPGGAHLPVFKPGAHIELSLRGLPRRYSLTSSPWSAENYEICVLRTTPSRGGSAFIHDEMKVGDTLEADGPMNAFCLNEGGATHSIFIAGGIGVTPFYSMMEALVRAGRTYELHYAARRYDRFLPVLQFSGRTTYYVDQGDRPRLDIDALLRGISSESHLYVCGPWRMIENVREKATAHGWPRHAVHFESFGGAPKQGDEPLGITLSRSGVTIEVAPGTSILDALRAHGVWASYQCLRGECATCATAFLSGEPDHRDVCLTAEQRKSLFCPCVSWSKTSNLTLDL